MGEVDFLPEVIDVLVDLGDGLELLWLTCLVHLTRSPLDALTFELLPRLLLAPAVGPRLILCYLASTLFGDLIAHQIGVLVWPGSF